MPFLVLGRNELGEKGAPNYRGTAREWPSYAESLPEDAEYNTFFLSYCEVEGEAGIFTDLSRARQMLTLLERHLHRRDFELVEVVTLSAESVSGGALLGYDLSAGMTYSVLSWGLKLADDSPVEPESSGGPEPLAALCTLIERHFRPRLNENGLFPDAEVASFCLRCMLALQELYSNLWENDEVTSALEVVAVYHVDP